MNARCALMVAGSWRLVANGLALLALLPATSNQLPAQEAPTRGGIILSLPTSPRALGLADASAAAAPDAWTTFASPAQLARHRSFSVGLASEAYLVSTQLSAAAITVPMARGTLGIGVSLLDYGSVDEIASDDPAIDGIETGRRYSAQDHAIVVAYGLPVRWIEGFTLGAAAEFVTTRIADLSGSAFAVTAGLGWASRNGWEVTATAQHMGSAIEVGASSGELPTIARLAIAAPSRHLGKFYVRPLAELRGSEDDGAALAVAAEAEWPSARGPSLFGRAGYTVRRADTDDRWPLSLGAGVTFGSWSIDYAPERFETIDQVTHRIGLRYRRRSSPK
jgi:hypothetical protein